eukprot:768208-Hanusia_phi.AAC.1
MAHVIELGDLPRVPGRDAAAPVGLGRLLRVQSVGAANARRAHRDEQHGLKFGKEEAVLDGTRDEPGRHVVLRLDELELRVDVAHDQEARREDGQLLQQLLVDFDLDEEDWRAVAPGCPLDLGQEADHRHVGGLRPVVGEALGLDLLLATEELDEPEGGAAGHADDELEVVGKGPVVMAMELVFQGGGLLLAMRIYIIVLPLVDRKRHHHPAAR